MNESGLEAWFRPLIGNWRCWPSFGLWRNFQFDLSDVFFKKWVNPGLFLFIFSLFKQTIPIIFTTNQRDKMSTYLSTRWHQDSNPWPYEHESSHITTRPGLLSLVTDVVAVVAKFYTFQIRWEEAEEAAASSNKISISNLSWKVYFFFTRTPVREREEVGSFEFCIQKQKLCLLPPFCCLLCHCITTAMPHYRQTNGQNYNFQNFALSSF